MKKNLWMVVSVLVIISITLAIVGCSNEMEGPHLGNLSLATDRLISRTIQPSGDFIAVDSYRVKGIGPAGATFMPVTSETSSIAVEG